MNKKQKRGISLIVLVITMLVIMLLAGTLILNLTNNNPISKSDEAKFKSNVTAYNSELALAISNKYLQNYSFDINTLNASIWDGVQADIAGTIKEYIPSITAQDGAKFEIQNSRLLYVGTDQIEKDLFSEIGVMSGNVTSSGVGVNVIAIKNTTVNGAKASYNNPIIPKGFKAINDGALWPTGWNEGLVIEDENGNQFVWVPVDGTNVPYAKWCTTGVSYASTSDDTVPSGFNTSNITTIYQGFYVARYESMFDYNGGNIRAASKKSRNVSAFLDWSLPTYDGYLWNQISYNDSKTYSENMDTSYGYDTSKVGTNLITGAEWDTVMKWIQNSGKSVTDSRAWGNHYDSTSPANIIGYSNLQISGFSDCWKVKNIYDLAGNTYEWTSEIYNSNRVLRGGFCGNSGSAYPVAFRIDIGGDDGGYNRSFRVALYVL